MIASKRFLPSTSQLLAFEAVARHQSVTAAAQELSLTQSAVSRQLQKLEAQIDIALFDRKKKRVKLTAAGEIYFEEIQAALKQIANVTLRLKSNPEGGSLNLAILPTFGTRWLAPRLNDFLTKNSGVTINLSTRLIPFNFDSEAMDAAIYFGSPSSWPECEYQKIMDEAILPACAPALLASVQITSPADLLKLPLLHLQTRPSAWQQWMKAHEVESSNLTGMFFDQFAMMSNAATQGVGVALLPQFLIESELLDGQLVSAYGDAASSQGSYYLVWPKQKAHYKPLLRFRTWLSGQTGCSV
jgi:LysR family glycine cleavage system transcriptional activator